MARNGLADGSGAPPAGRIALFCNGAWVTIPMSAAHSAPTQTFASPLSAPLRLDTPHIRGDAGVAVF